MGSTPTGNRVDFPLCPTKRFLALVEWSLLDYFFSIYFLPVIPEVLQEYPTVCMNHVSLGSRNAKQPNKRPTTNQRSRQRKGN